jgi:hypothetical protein
MSNLHSAITRTVVHAQNIGATPEDEGNAPCWLLLSFAQQTLAKRARAPRYSSSTISVGNKVFLEYQPRSDSTKLVNCFTSPRAYPTFRAASNGAMHAHDQSTWVDQDSVLQLGALDHVIVPSTLAVSRGLQLCAFRGCGASRYHFNIAWRGKGIARRVIQSLLRRCWAALWWT